MANWFCCVNEETGQFHAILSAYLSIIAGVVEAVMAVASGHEEISMSLYGIALVAIVDITGSVLVLKMWQCRSAIGERQMSERLTEMNYSIVIGVLMIMLGIFLIADSTKSLSEGEAPNEDDVWGLVVTIIGCVCGLSLGAYKFAVGKVLDSNVIVADSVSSFCAGVSSAAALLVIFINSKVWWSDSTAGFLTALYTLYNGVVTVATARAKSYELKKSVNFNVTQFRKTSIKKAEQAHLPVNELEKDEAAAEVIAYQIGDQKYLREYQRVDDSSGATVVNEISGNPSSVPFPTYQKDLEAPGIRRRAASNRSRGSNGSPGGGEGEGGLWGSVMYVAQVLNPFYDTSDRHSYSSLSQTEVEEEDEDPSSA